MIAGFASTGRILTENIYKRFAAAPWYLVHDTVTGSIEAIANHCRHHPGWNAAAAASLLIDRGVEVVICGDLDPAGEVLFAGRGVPVLRGFPGTAAETLERLRSELARLPRDHRASGHGAPRAPMQFLDLDVTFTGEHVLYDDWDFALRVPAVDAPPLDWLRPVNYADGTYHLRLDVTSLAPTTRPVDFEFGWSNLPKELDPDISHRCSFGSYASFGAPGVFEHVALVDDMEKTTLNGDEKPWDWSRAWHQPFFLVKPYGQRPYPIRCRVRLDIYPAAVVAASPGG